MKIQVIASGSKGNCTIIKTKNKTILIDIGISFLSLQKKLDDNSFSIDEIDILLITHTHKDHISGLKTFAKKTDTKIYVTNEINSELIDIKKDNFIIIEKTFKIESLEVKLLSLSHDTPNTYGYIITEEENSIVYITDTGYINRNLFPYIRNKTVYIIESNYDEEMLLDGPYPRCLKERVISDSGHLSNKSTAKYLNKLVGENTKCVILAHLSEKNNTEELAYTETKKVLSNDINVYIAKQNEVIDKVEI